jgi:phosphoribosylformimino-5-aminoimidazole carboxamide ribotide isomerase
MALRWEGEGAEWLHLVDLDGAMDAGRQNRVLAKQIVQALEIPVQFGGGLRTLEDLKDMIEGGASRLILGTAAVENRDLLLSALRLFPGKIAVGIDARDGRVAIQGWNRVENLDALDFARECAGMGVERIIHTDISRDGMLTGPNFAATGRIARESGLKVIASGGISSLDDIRTLRSLQSGGVEGAILGKALYEKKLTLSEALHCALEG